MAKDKHQITSTLKYELKALIEIKAMLKHVRVKFKEITRKQELFNTAYGSNPDKLDEDCNTELMVAARSGQALVVKTLLAEGASIDIIHSDTNWTAIKSAAYSFNTQTLENLLKQGNRFGAANKWAEWLLAATKSGNGKIVKAIIEECEKLDYIDRRGRWSALTLAFLHGHREVQGLLTEAGATAVHFKDRSTAEAKAAFQAIGDIKSLLALQKMEQRIISQDIADANHIFTILQPFLNILKEADAEVRITKLRDVVTPLAREFTLQNKIEAKIEKILFERLKIKVKQHHGTWREKQKIKLTQEESLTTPEETRLTEAEATLSEQDQAKANHKYLKFFGAGMANASSVFGNINKLANADNPEAKEFFRQTGYTAKDLIESVEVLYKELDKFGTIEEKREKDLATTDKKKTPEKAREYSTAVASAGANSNTQQPARETTPPTPLAEQDSRRQPQPAAQASASDTRPSPQRPPRRHSRSDQRVATPPISGLTVVHVKAEQKDVSAAASSTPAKPPRAPRKLRDRASVTALLDAAMQASAPLTPTRQGAAANAGIPTASAPTTPMTQAQQEELDDSAIDRWIEKAAQNSPTARSAPITPDAAPQDRRSRGYSIAARTASSGATTERDSSLNSLASSAGESPSSHTGRTSKARLTRAGSSSSGVGV